LTAATPELPLHDPADPSPSTGAEIWVSVALDVPLDGVFDYRAPEGSRVGQRVVVPFGRRAMVGMIVDLPEQPAIHLHKSRR